MTSENGQIEQIVMSKDELQHTWDDLAAEYSRRTWLHNHLFGITRLRRKLMRQASGEVLDVACGTGENFPFFSSDSDITAIDLSPGMLNSARERAGRLGLKVDFHVMDAEALEFPDNRFDTVVSSLSTCTFHDPITALMEIRRVCRADGRILLLEHGRSSLGLLAKYQDRNAHKHFEKAAGCRWNREPLEPLQEAGLGIVSERSAFLGIFHAIEAAPRK